MSKANIASRGQEKRVIHEVEMRSSPQGRVLLQDGAFYNNHFHQAISEDFSRVFLVFYSWLFFFAKLVLVLVVTNGYP